MPGRLAFLLPLLVSSPSFAAALNFEWDGSDGNTYWAGESVRHPCNATPALTGGADDGLSYFSVGGPIDWPQFNDSANVVDAKDVGNLPPGAYVSLALPGSICVVAKAYQIHADPAMAFTGGATPVLGGDSLSESASFTTFSGGNIPVPPAVGDGPLSGLRFAVKDIFNVNGLPTSGGSRAYRDTFGVQNFTNEIIEISLAAGAQLVGKTKTIAFALGTPRNGWEVDYQDPWSLRGDGYQTTGGSSSGSSAAIVAYDFLDFTIGSDTGGSVRFPARFAGFYGYKPSHGIYNLTGILPAIAEQDTPGHMARSPSIFTRVGRVWLASTELSSSSTSSSSSSPPAFPTTLQYWSDEAPLTQPDAEAMKLDFFSKVEAALSMTPTSINITKSFNEHITNSSANDYYYTVYQDQNSAQSWDLIGQPLSAAYAAKHGDGAYPPTDPVVNMTWADGVNATSRARYPEAVRKREEYAAWFNKYILPVSSDGSCTAAIAAHSLHVPPSTVKYDQTPFGLVRGFYNGMQASFAGFPEIVVPIGQVQYRSNFTRRLEWQTVTVAFAAAKGCDAVLFDLVDKLEEAGLVEEVMPGKVAYLVDEA